MSPIFVTLNVVWSKGVVGEKVPDKIIEDVLEPVDLVVLVKQFN